MGFDKNIFRKVKRGIKFNLSLVPCSHLRAVQLVPCHSSTTPAECGHRPDGLGHGAGGYFLRNRELWGNLRIGEFKNKIETLY